MKMLITTAIARAVDTQDATLAGMLADHAREHGMTHRELFERVLEVRPGVELGAWDALLEEADLTDARASVELGRAVEREVCR